MGTHNICLYKEVDKKYTGCSLKTMELLDSALIGVCAVIRSSAQEAFILQTLKVPSKIPVDDILNFFFIIIIIQIKQEFCGRRHRTCWGKRHRSHNQNVVIK